MQYLEDNDVQQEKQDWLSEYDYFIALDWSIHVVAIAHLRSSSRMPKVVLLESNLKVVLKYLKGLRGRKLLTFEETTGSHWLYVELRESVDRILVCDPYRNSLLSNGPKTDKIDAAKLCLLLRAGLLHEVHHAYDSDYWIRKFVRSYLSLVKNGVRALNQHSALYRALGQPDSKTATKPDHELLRFVSDSLEESIAFYHDLKERYNKHFLRLVRQNKVIGYLKRINGIGVINAVLLYGLVLDASRFRTKYLFWSYCGLVRHEKWSGSRKYGKRKSRYVGVLKCIFRTAAIAAISGKKNDIREYYETLLAKGYSLKKAQHAVSRYIATSCYAVMKHKQPYKPYQWRRSETKT